jgi:hypothetical protein
MEEQQQVVDVRPDRTAPAETIVSKGVGPETAAMNSSGMDQIRAGGPGTGRDGVLP